MISCTGWNSELDTAYIGGGKTFQKPRCQFKLKENCWSRSVKLLMDCVQPVEPSKETLTEDMHLCQNGTGKIVEFKNINVDLVKENLEFTVYDSSKLCFEFRGKKSEFLIDSVLGSLKVKILENGDTRVSCFFNESFVIPAKVKKQGCRGEKTLVSEFLPEVELTSETKTLKSGNEVLDGFSFHFLGAGFFEPVFNCRKPELK